MTEGRAFIVAAWDMDPSIDDHTFNDWYESEHMPKRLACPGFIRGRRFRSIEGSPRYCTIYELESADALVTPEFLSLYSTHRKDVDALPETVRMVGAMTNLVRNVFVEIPRSVEDFEQTRPAKVKD